MANKSTESIAVPTDELARQATDVITGFGYQLYQTVSAWMALKPEDRLLVEIAEDYAVAGDQALTLTQVKHTKATLTLRSKTVAALMRAVWSFQIENPGRIVRAVLLTTARIGKEKGLAFPNALSGLAYWRVAAREQADIEPLRAVLLNLDLPDNLKAFLKTASPDDVRAKLLRRIHWYGSGRSHEELERDLEEQLIYYGQAHGVGAQDARNVLSALVVEILRCSGRPPATRYVTAADFAAIFEKNTYRLIPPSALPSGLPLTGADGQLTDTALAASDTSSVPLPPRAALRAELVGKLHADLVTAGTSWLHGSSGLGKTTLALLMARRQNATWLFADLRDLLPNAVRLTLARIAASFAVTTARGLILDDFPADPDNATTLALRRVARAVADADGVLVVTGAKPPPPTLVSALEVRTSTVHLVPYLTEDDVGQMVSLAGGDAALWKRVIFTFSGGHPQLVDARIVGLRLRGWPKDERLADILPMEKRSGDMELERRSVRARLLREMDTDSRELLFRLSLLMNNFNRDMALTVTQVSPVIAQAGIVFDSLVGPWIEQVGPERYRLSLLLRDSGDAGLATDLRTAIKSAVLSHLLLQRPFPADQMMQVFILGFTLRNVQALGWFSAALVSTAYRDKAVFKRLAEEVSVFAMVDRDKAEPLLPESLNISVMLRYAQLLVTLAVRDAKRAAEVLERALAETAQLDGKLKTYTLSVILSSALIDPTLPLPPRRWMDMLLTLSALPETGEMLRQRPVYTDPFSGLTVKPSHEEMMFVIRASALNGIDELCELVDVMDKLPAVTRDRYLKTAATVSQSTTHIVTSAWLSEVRRKGFDSKAAAAKIAVLRSVAANWQSAEMAVELACAQAVMLDEYAGDKDAALAVLAESQSRYPQDYRINRQRQKVYYHNGDHTRALKEFETFADALPKSSPVDSAFALREAGRSAAEIGDLDKTRYFFEEAWKSAAKCSDHMLPMKAGLSADCAILDFQAGKTDSALTLMLRALTEAEPIDPAKGLKEHYCVLILVTAILWMRGGAADWPVERQTMVIGMCSNPDPLAEIRDRPLPQRLLAWYELAELETEVSDHEDCLIALRERTKQGGLLPMETMLAVSVLQAATRTVNVDRFLKTLHIYPRALEVAIKTIPGRKPEDVLKMPIGSIKPITVMQWREKTISEASVSAVLIFALMTVASGRRDAYDDLFDKVSKQSGLGQVVAPLFTMIAGPAEKRSDAIPAVADIVGQMVDPDFVFDAAEAFAATVHIVQVLAGHVLGETVAGAVLRYFEAEWKDILAKRTFSVRNPSAVGPFILAAFSKGISNMAKLANVVLASESAVRAHLSDELRTTVHRIAEPERKPVTYIEPNPVDSRPK